MNKYKKGPSTNLMTPKMVTIPPPPLLLERENTTRFFKYNCTNMFIQFFTYNGNLNAGDHNRRNTTRKKNVYNILMEKNV